MSRICGITSRGPQTLCPQYLQYHLRTSLTTPCTPAVVPYQSIAPWYQIHASHSKRIFLLARYQRSHRKVVHTCDICQKCKITAVEKYGKIPLPKHTNLAPWEELHVDLIGPWDVRYNLTDSPGKTVIEKLHALTIIDKATAWPEFIAILNKTSQNIALLLMVNGCAATQDLPKSFTTMALSSPGRSFKSYSKAMASNL